jgi:hypothetical protein
MDFQNQEFREKPWGKKAGVSFKFYKLVLGG